MKKLSELFNIRKGDVVSIVGSGGKTTMLFKLAEELKEQYRVLVSTSTKIGKPSEDKCDYLYIGVESYINRSDSNTDKNGITVVSKGINLGNNKLFGIDDEDLDVLINDFDIVLLEADGSRRLPAKGWKDNEPPILKRTNKTIGIIPSEIINKRTSSDFIYGFDEFNKLTDYSEYVDFEAIGKICSKENGLFKNSRGRLYLYLNKTDTEEKIILSKKLSGYLKEFIVGRPYDFKICAGSFKKGSYYEC
ncbi:MAG TPA: putative selenium-dependent hydroxylase accessory protein YqeC [Clostridiales bacterium]|nr:putative selenium-dependent hydroxylase accessory protein YqeC [Clostridiales bacterium]